MSEEEKKMALALREWALQKVFGPALTEIEEDLRKLYAKGRDKLILAAYRKVRNPDDGKQANLRVMRDVLWNGAFSEDEVCAEYFGGILASSRSKEGKDDDAIQFVDVIKSLSAKQLRLHYVIYNSLNKVLLAAGKPVNVALSTEIKPKQVWFSSTELVHDLGLRIEADLNILHRQSLLDQCHTYSHRPVENEQARYYTVANPTTFGVLLYAASHNRLDEWRTFDQQDFGNFPEIALPAVYAPTLDELLKKAGLVGATAPSRPEHDS
jgi:hypothetical protein